MTGKQPIPPRLLRAYRQTTYCAEGVPVRIGRRSPAMDALLARHAALAAVFVTAWNPFSRRMPQAWNQRMQQRLLLRLHRRTVLPASGAAGRWHEDHLLVLAALPWVLQQARLFRQNAVVSIRRGGKVRLHLTGRAAASGPGDGCGHLGR